MAALWDIKGEEAVEKKLSDISDGVRHQSRHHNARLFSSDSESGSIIETTNRVTAKRVCCGSSRFGSPFDGPGQKELMVVHNSN